LVESADTAGNAQLLDLDLALIGSSDHSLNLLILDGDGVLGHQTASLQLSRSKVDLVAKV